MSNSVANLQQRNQDNKEPGKYRHVIGIITDKRIYDCQYCSGGLPWRVCHL